MIRESYNEWSARLRDSSFFYWVRKGLNADEYENYLRQVYEGNKEMWKWLLR